MATHDVRGDRGSRGGRSRSPRHSVESAVAERCLFSSPLLQLQAGRERLPGFAGGPLQRVVRSLLKLLGAVPQTLIPLIEAAADLGLGAAGIGLALGLRGSLARFAGTFLGGWLSNRISRKAALAPGLIGQAAGVALLALEPRPGSRG